MIALFQSSLTRSETIDSTPPTKVLPSRFYLLNDNTVATTTNRVVQLDAASPVTALDGYTLTIALTEPQRVQALEISNTPGGDETGKKETRLETDRKHDWKHDWTTAARTTDCVVVVAGGCMLLHVVDCCCMLLTVVDCG